MLWTRGGVGWWRHRREDDTECAWDGYTDGTPGAGCARVSYAVALLLASAPSRGNRATWLAIEAVRRRGRHHFAQLLGYGRLDNEKF